jgi:hypothetical protein
MRFLTLLAVLVCSTAVGQDVIYATRSCANGQCRQVSDTSTAQGVAEACARSGRLQHLGGNGGLSLLAFGVVTYAKNVAYVVPLAAGAFVGTYITVRWRHE